jgi:hypothetical protein
VKTIILTLAAATALTAGAAAAQPYGYAYGRADSRWVPIDQRQERLAFRIDQGLRSGQLTPREAFRLRMEFNQIARLEARYRINGLSNWERADLDRRMDLLTDEIRVARRDDDRRYGYNNYYPPY